MEAERTRSALERNASAAVDQIETIRPSSVCRLHSIIQTIYERGKLDFQASYTGARYRYALGHVARAAKQHLIPNVALHLPDIGRMGLQDVDRVEIDLSLVLLRELVQGGNLPPEGWSSVAAEDENDWPVLPKLG
jgi:hypothetical protein